MYMQLLTIAGEDTEDTECDVDEAETDKVDAVMSSLPSNPSEIGMSASKSQGISDIHTIDSDPNLDISRDWTIIVTGILYTCSFLSLLIIQQLTHEVHICVIHISVA